MGKAVVALSYKGGTGKSTLMASIAYAFRRELPSLRVVALDLTEDQLLTDYLAPSCRARGVVEFVYGSDLEVCKETDGALVDVVPFGTPSQLPPDAALLIADVIEALKERYDVVFIDVPGVGETYNALLRPILEKTDVVMIVATPATIRQAQMARDLVGDSRPVVAILNMYIDGAPKHEMERLGITRYGRYYFTVPFDAAAWRAAIEKRLAVLYKTNYWKHIDEIATELYRLILSLQ